MKMRKGILAVIPARGGSKRLKNKNILPLMGVPMIGHTIRAARESKIFEDVLVSTDNSLIAGVSKKLGATVPFLRNPKLADDYTPVAIATLEALNQMELYTGKTYETVVQLMPNCPCRTAEDIAKAYEQFCKNKATFQISVFRFGFMNPWWAMRLKKNNQPHVLFPEAYKQRSQDMDPLYCPTGALWVARSKELRKAGTFYGKGYHVFIMDWMHAVDIDDVHDFALAEIVLKQRRSLMRKHK